MESPDTGDGYRFLESGVTGKGEKQTGNEAGENSRHEGVVGPGEQVIEVECRIHQPKKAWIQVPSATGSCSPEDRNHADTNQLDN